MTQRSDTGGLRKPSTGSLSRRPGTGGARFDSDASGLSLSGIKGRSFLPLEPKTVEDTGLRLDLIADLALKTMYFRGFITGQEISESMRLPFVNIVDKALDFLKREKYCEVRGSAGFGEMAYQYTITSRGGERAREILDRNQYTGPAPVPLEVYNDAVRKQTINNVYVSEDDMNSALSHLVISPDIMERIGPAANSGRSIFLYGPPGNGKTVIAEAIAKMLKGDVFLPYAVEVEGHIIRVFDAVNHKPLEDPTVRPTDHDWRWMLCQRPVVVVGGELTLASLDLVYDDSSKFYEAPFQMKANCGMFIIDDFGRQQVRPRDLLNRWIVPLEKRLDFLTLRTGKKIEVPFDVLIVFSTNIPPRELVDEAFLRRIRHKIEIRNPTYDEYREIFRRVCQSRGVRYEDEGVIYLLREHYVQAKRPLRACHPRDIVDQLVDTARFLKMRPALTQQLLDRASAAYFVEL
ncbi:MAG: AAA family ATPase [Chloroflexi bacterium]|nr:AAA family ATPase [Chloroflexota bacterium]MBU1747493.1 AAA family ATPase [Chloroflexota bacterium]